MPAWCLLRRTPSRSRPLYSNLLRRKSNVHCGGVHTVNQCLIHWCFSMDFKGMQNLAQSVLFYIYVESSTIDCRIRLYNEMQHCSARPDKSQLESGEVHWNMLIRSSCNVLIHWKFQWNVLLHFSHNAFLICWLNQSTLNLSFAFQGCKTLQTSCRREADFKILNHSFWM